MSDNKLRRHLVKMLSEPNAHLTFEKAIEYVPPQLRGILMEGYGHTAWQILEHLRISQWDILEFSRDAGHVSPKFPDGYWPEEPSPPDDKSWDESVGRFQSDLKQMCDLISEESNDLFEKIPHGDGQTLLREALLLAKHNSYHTGQLAMLKYAVK
jgi:hypothetical protein